MNIKDGDDAVVIVRDVIQGEALRAFSTKLSKMTNPISMDDVNECIDAVTKTLFPHRALARQKRYMRRFMRKPAGMPIRAYVARIYKLNKYLKEFPPFGKQQALLEDKLVELVECGIPNVWQKQMVMQGFDPINHTMRDLINFTERLEVVETMDGHHHKKPAGVKPKARPSAAKKSNGATLHAKSSAEAIRLRMCDWAQTRQSWQTCRERSS